MSKCHGKNCPCSLSKRHEWFIAYCDLRDRMVKQLAALPPTPTPGWQPMDTAPKDGTWVLTVDSRGTQTVTKYVRRFNDIESWIDAHNYEHGTSAWQPLPPAPTGERE
jgi:hypothetical protein